MNNPVSTYRLQFHKDFTFDHFKKVIPYLINLGVKTIYASPIFEATSGSVHGYDGLNPHKINPEIGTEQELLEIQEQLKEAGISWLQDIVPNHMAFDPNNKWLQDVLEKGRQSTFASFFDVPWTGKLYQGKIMLPFLGSSLDEVINNDELKIVFNGERFVLEYYDSGWPLHLHSYLHILQVADVEPPTPVSQLLQLIKETQKLEDAEEYAGPFHEMLLQLAALFKNEESHNYIEKCLGIVNGSKELISNIANEQVYKLCNWQRTDYQINFRRFFTVNGLICLNIQNPNVFAYYHKYIKELVDRQVFQGLRIDHIDGLFNPTFYLKQLRELAGDKAYIVVEKILEPGEQLPSYWPIEGNTGYDFLCYANNLLTNKQSETQFTEFYNGLVNDTTSIHQQIHDKKSHILYEHMAGELDNLHNLFVELNLANEGDLEQLDKNLLKEAIAEFLIQCPVYRYYGNKLPLSEWESANIREILNRIKKSKSHLTEAVDIIEKVLLINPANENEEYNANVLRFYQRCMQFTGPLMAKGVEDTIMYTYNRFIGHNEVGDSPEAFGDSPEEYHEKMKDRQKNWPLSINGTSTHDTKRGEDVRARLNVLTDLPDEWFSMVEEWKKLNAELKTNGFPDDNDEYLIYQTLVGAYPNPGEGDDDFENRIKEYLQKALREAKIHSNWTTPNEEYEEATKSFAARLLNKDTSFWKNFEAYHAKIANYGVVNSLAQLILKCTSPGVPDIYQGTELSDFSLVDPDNRRLVDYQLRESILKELRSGDQENLEAFLQNLWKNKFSGKLKLWLTQKLLSLRNENVDLFSKGEYLPLKITGTHKDSIISYARVLDQKWVVIALPLHLAEMCNQQNKDMLEVEWADTIIELPAEAPEKLTNIISGEESRSSGKINVADIFKRLPMAIFKSN